jgi:TDG/mug DNA glycosylase family protein
VESYRSARRRIQSRATKLPNVLGPDLDVVFCGTAAGDHSAALGCYYAGPDKFWPTLATVGLTPNRLRPEDFRELLKFKIGLTDLAQKVSGPDSSLRSNDFDIAGFCDRILRLSPRYVAFNGKKASQIALGLKTVAYGLHEQTIGQSEVFVLPSTSGLAAGKRSVEPWQTLAALVMLPR